MNQFLLLSLIVLPIAGATVCALLPQSVSKSWALGVSLVGAVLASVLFNNFDPSMTASFQFPFKFSWIAKYRVAFALGVDGISLPLVVLSKFMMPIAILASWNNKEFTRAFMACFLVLDGAMAGTFLATDIFLFYVFWELVLIPMVLIIGVWGSQDRIYAALKFFLVTFAGSLLMLVAIFWVYISHFEQFGYYSSEIESFYKLSFAGAPLFLGLNPEVWVFLAFGLAFLIKVPVVPFHTWLPDAHVQAPTGGSILLAAVLLKMGTYGLLRFCIPIAPGAFAQFGPVLVVLSLVGILYGAWVAFQQEDMKKLVAYSSISHLGFVVLGICAGNSLGLTGAILQMVNHGITSGALFLLVGILYERRHTRNLADFGGLAAQIPRYAFFLVLVSCASMAVPGLNGFVGEFLILLGTFRTNPVWAGIAVLGVIFAAVYTLWMVRGVLWGKLDKSENESIADLGVRELVMLGSLSAFIIGLGVYPQPFVDKIKPTLEQYWEKPENSVARLNVESPS